MGWYCVCCQIDRRGLGVAFMTQLRGADYTLARRILGWARATVHGDRGSLQS